MILACADTSWRSRRRVPVVASGSVPPHAQPSRGRMTTGLRQTDAKQMTTRGAGMSIRAGQGL